MRRDADNRALMEGWMDCRAWFSLITGALLLALAGAVVWLLRMLMLCFNPMRFLGWLTLGGLLLLAGGLAVSFIRFVPATHASFVQGSPASHVTATAALASIPATCADGQIFLPSNSYYLFRCLSNSWVPWGVKYAMTAPVDGAFSWINQGSASVSTANGGIKLSTIADSGSNLRFRTKTAPATPYTITAAFNHQLVEQNTHAIGLMFRQSSTGGIAGLSMVFSSVPQFNADKWTSATVFSANYIALNQNSWWGQHPLWMQISDDGVNRILRYGNDGVNWIQHHTVGRTDFLTADQVGFYVKSANTTWPATVVLLSWKEDAF